MAGQRGREEERERERERERHRAVAVVVEEFIQNRKREEGAERDGAGMLKCACRESEGEARAHRKDFPLLLSSASAPVLPLSSRGGGGGR